jgi:tetratricopeptide (TPR) repeat protein
VDTVSNPDRRPPIPDGGVGLAAWIRAGLVALNLAVYASVRGNGFVTWDDGAYVAANPQVARGLTRDGAVWAFTTLHAGNWHPLTWLSHMLDVQLFGMDAGAHHVVGLVLHVANTLLLFGVLRRMTGATARAAFVAALFAVHPLHVESVAWAAERKDVLSTLFLMLALGAYVEYARRPSARRYVAVAAWFAAGLMSKPMLVTFPFLLLLLDYWPLRRTAGAGGDPGAARTWRNLVREKVPLFTLSAASSAVAFLAQRGGGAVSEVARLPVGARVANALTSYVAYVRTTLWPADLSPLYLYGPTSIRFDAALGAALVLVVVTWLAVREAERRPYLIVGWLWFLGGLAPVIGLVQVGIQSMADRYTYVPSVGLFIVAAWGAADIAAAVRVPRYVVTTAAALVVAACAVVASRQVGVWRDSVALWRQATRASAGNFVAHVNLGFALQLQERNDEAVAEYSEALRLKPDYGLAHNDLGDVLGALGRVDEAIAETSRAVRIEPSNASWRCNLGFLLKTKGDVAAAKREFDEALRIEPANVEARRESDEFARRGVR